VITASGSRAVRLAQQAFGELTRFQGRDNVSLAFEEPGGSLGEGGGLGGRSGKLPDFGEIQQAIALQVKLVGPPLRVRVTGGKE
jgi:hypothetical protein